MHVGSKWGLGYRFFVSKKETVSKEFALEAESDLVNASCSLALRVFKTGPMIFNISRVRGFNPFERPQSWLVPYIFLERLLQATALQLVLYFLMLIRSASEITAITKPYAAILDVFEHRSKYTKNCEDVGHLQVKWWYGGIGGLVAATGFVLCGWRLTRCLGDKLTYMSNSRGWALQSATIAAMIIVSRVKLPVSSVQVFVGSLIGVGIADDHRNANWKLVYKIMLGWIMTTIFCCDVAYLFFSAYVVP
ncbi:hypothetical protein GQ457_09G003190 [Hibiscus cannabinus]